VSADDLVYRLLDVALTRMGMELSWLSSFESGDQVFDRISGPASDFGLYEGASSPLSDSYCARVIDGRLPNLISDTAQNDVTASLAVTKEMGIGAYIGVPVRRTDGTPQGMLCCVNSGHAHHLTDSDVHTLELLAELLAEIINVDGPAAKRDLAIANRVDTALADQEMHVVYQPIANIASGRIVGVESLCRFAKAPERPNVWFTEAASVGLGVELELAAIELALAGFTDLAPDVYLAVNASPTTVCDQRLAALVAAHQPGRTVVEITEHSAIASYETLDRSLEKLRSVGARIAVDDAGAGFASLAHVLEIRPAIVKIDRSIAKGIHLDPARVALLQTIVDVARRLGATVIAEGVETQEDLETLGAHGVTHAQGFLVAEPAPLPGPAFAASTAVVSQTVPLPERGEDLGTRRFELAMLHSPVGMALVSTTGYFLHVNPAFSALLGHPMGEITALSFRDIVYSDDVAQAEDAFSRLVVGESESYRAERRLCRADGSVIWTEVSVVVVHSEGHPTYVICQLQDITERLRRESDLAQSASTDYLTSVANRSAARQYLEELDSLTAPYAVMYCDVRSFKAVNDLYGHRAGDHVLKTLASRLSAAVRSDDMVSRWGGDEFLIVVGRASAETVQIVLDRVTAAVASPISLPNNHGIVDPGMTIGVATNFSDPQTTSIDQVLHCADRDMYRQRQVNIQP